MITTGRPAAASASASVDHGDPSRRRLDLGGILRSEWTKLRSVRSTLWTLLATFGIMVGFGALLSAAFVSRYDRLSPIQLARFDPTVHSLRGLFLAQLTIGVLGVLVMTNEYSTGMIRNAFAAVPQRRAVLSAKAVIFGASALLIGLLGLGLGALLRRTAGAIATLFALVLVLPILAEALPSPWNSDVQKLLPGGAGQAILNVRNLGDSLSPSAGFALFAGYVALALGAALFMVARRDACRERTRRGRGMVGPCQS